MRNPIALVILLQYVLIVIFEVGAIFNCLTLHTEYTPQTLAIKPPCLLGVESRCCYTQKRPQTLIIEPGYLYCIQYQATLKKNCFLSSGWQNCGQSGSQNIFFFFFFFW